MTIPDAWSLGGPKRSVQCISSALLSKEENEVVWQLLGQRCPSLATTVVQIYRSEGPTHNRWNKRSCGIACFVKDNTRRSYYIRIFDMDRRIVIFDQEIYTQFRYKTPRPYFHTFEADDGQVGLNFADETEADLFQQVISEKIEERRQKLERRGAVKRNSLVLGSSIVGQIGSANGQNGGTNGAQFQDFPQAAPPPSSTGIMMNGGGSSFPILGQSTKVASHQPARHYYFTKKKGDKKRLTKEDISRPTNFQHISHVGWDPNRGFDLENVDSKLKQFFSRAGVSEKDFQDKDTREFIYDFIEKHGGVDAALMEEDTRTGSTPPPSQISQTVEFSPSGSGPALPPRHSSITHPAPPSKVQATPYKSSQESSHYQHQQQSPSYQQQQQQSPSYQQQQQSPPYHQQQQIIRQPLTKGSAPPPPPPLPPMALSSNKSAAPPPPPPPPPPNVQAPAPAPPSMPPVYDVRNDLMAQIRQGSDTLRHVDAEEKKPRPSSDNRGNLLDQIRSGVSLKKVEAESPNRGENSSALSGIAGMLQKALHERSAAICQSSSEDEEADDEDDWEE